MNTITLTLHRKWFDLILSGQKQEEYREIKPYWVRRLLGNWQQYNENSVFYKGQQLLIPFGVTAITFKNGYSAGARRFTIEWKGLEVKEPNPEWVPLEDANKLFFALKLGRVLF